MLRFRLAKLVPLPARSICDLQGLRRSVKAAESGGHHGCKNDCARRRRGSGGYCVSEHVAGSDPLYKNQLDVVELLFPPSRRVCGSLLAVNEAKFASTKVETYR
jgi:hypothetical protein